MKKLLNTLYVMSEDAYLGLDGENVVVKKANAVVMRLPIHNIDSIVAFNYVGASPALLRKCGEHNVPISFFQKDYFCGCFISQENGNVILRKTQYRYSDMQEKSLDIARNIVIGKVHNERYVLGRALRDHEIRIDATKVERAMSLLQESINHIKNCATLDELRGYEGEAAACYFGVFDQLILRSKEDFKFKGRNRRPPLDRVNALLSFAYSLLSNECAGAAYSVGLDPYVGFLHRDRPGRKSLALDLMEELRSPIADRFVLTLINKQQVKASDFFISANQAVTLKDDLRRMVIQKWQETKQEMILHPFIKEKIQIGLIPYVQAMLLARYLREDLDAYPPFLKR